MRNIRFPNLEVAPEITKVQMLHNSDLQDVFAIYIIMQLSLVDDHLSLFNLLNI